MENAAETADDNFKMPSSKEKDVADATVLGISITEPKLEYTPPPFAIQPPNDADYGFEIIKNGIIINRINFKERKASTFVVIGRLPSCDVELEHPTISRHHCILQYGEDLMNRTGKGWHIYDLSSTHGTKLNKKRIPPKRFIRIHVGHVMQFGGSSRILTLFGPSFDVDEEWEYSPTEMKRLIEQKKLYDKIQREKEEALKIGKESDGIMWGMDYDEELAYAQIHEGDDIQDREERYRTDPVKVLSRFFEKEGFDMEFTYEESGTGHNHKWICSIELPVDTAAGQSLLASAVCSGSKKESQTLCAFDACKTLDMHGLLFRSSNEVRKKAKNLADNDYYDSDEDTYFDRTGQIEKNREMRRQRAMEMKGQVAAEIETFETLTKKIASTSEELSKVVARLGAISKKREEKNDEKKSDDEDDLDKFCNQLGHFNDEKDSMAVKTEKSILRHRLVALKHEKERLEKLAKIAKPVELPTLIIPPSSQGGSRAAGSLSATTIKKLMKIRQTKRSILDEKERDVQLGMELPPDTFIKETGDKVPFVAEVEDDEKPVNDDINISSSVRQRDFLTETDAESELNIPSMAPNSEERPVIREFDKCEADLVTASNAGYEVPQHADNAVSNKTQILIAKDDRSSKRKRIRIRDTVTSKREKNGDYGDGIVNRDEDYVMWMPPENQKGDGTNALNAKFAGKY
uniref:FHA domain-containing protein n=1 Tax=Setaria digitata TaxID=48799 RepID=A0A915PSS7_9BILA